MTKQEYNTVHKWVQYNYPKTGTCEHCKTSGLKGRKIQWANVSGDYKRERADWLELCAKCHQKFDNRYKTTNPIYEECLNCGTTYRTYKCLVGIRFYCKRECYTMMRTGKNKNFSLSRGVI